MYLTYRYSPHIHLQATVKVVHRVSIVVKLCPIESQNNSASLDSSQRMVTDCHTCPCLFLVS